MSKKNGQGNSNTTDSQGQPITAAQLPDALPGELPAESDIYFGPETADETIFVNLKEPGETFTGKFIRRVDKGGSEELKYPGFLFAEYPSGALKVLPANWSIGEEIAARERDGCVIAGGNVVPMEDALMRLTLREIKKNPKDDTSVKLFVYQYATQPMVFPSRIQWNEQFQQTPARAGK